VSPKPLENDKAFYFQDHTSSTTVWFLRRLINGEEVRVYSWESDFVEVDAPKAGMLVEEGVTRVILAALPQ
jgi:hypothetical protein